MHYLLTLLLAVLATTPTVKAQSNLLESVKRDPKEAIAFCKEFRSLNSQGESATSQRAITELSGKKNITKIEAEILSIYIIGLHCPEVK